MAYLVSALGPGSFSIDSWAGISKWTRDPVDRRGRRSSRRSGGRRRRGRSVDTPERPCAKGMGRGAPRALRCSLIPDTSRGAAAGRRHAKLWLEGLRRQPERTRVDAIRVEGAHLVVEIACAVGCLEDAREVADVPAAFPRGPRIPARPLARGAAAGSSQPREGSPLPAA